MLPIGYFDRFRTELLGLRVPDERSGKYMPDELMSERFHLFSECGLDVYYAPFHYLNKNARVLLVGLTPGWTQMEQAFRAARLGLAQGFDGEALFRHIDTTASFSGPMRKNLVSMLDDVGLHHCLKLDSCKDLFDDKFPQPLVGFTSAVSAPIFRAGANYGGHGPPLLKVPRLEQWVFENLANEIASVPGAVIIPLGAVADKVIQSLGKRRPPLVGLDRCLMRFPHPSGANGHRRRDFESGRERWRGQLASWCS